MRSRRGAAVIASVTPDGPAFRAGVRPGDRIMSMGGRPVADIIDYLYLSDEPELVLRIDRGGRKLRIALPLSEGEDPGLALEDFAVRSCGNNCVFCFVGQLPRGMRRPLYLKDDDYRMSFLYGNYVTLTNLTAADRERIVKRRLSPLYVSVHTTNDTLRRVMLGNRRAPSVLPELRYFADHRIGMHTQIVLCPGYNDREELDRTLGDLSALYPAVQSVAVVPVGLTTHGRGGGLRPVGKRDARRALAQVAAHRKACKRAFGDPLVHPADELFIKAGEPFPPLGYYGELAQIENGVGMVAGFEREARIALRRPGRRPTLRALTFTGVSFYPYLAAFAEGLRERGWDLSAVKVANRFFGPRVTVAGLLTGRDVIRALGRHVRGFDAVLVPDVMLREGERVFLDDVTVEGIEKALGIRAIIIESSPRGLIEGMREGKRWT